MSLGAGHGNGRSNGKNRTVMLDSYRAARTASRSLILIQPLGTSKNPCTYSGQTIVATIVGTPGPPQVGFELSLNDSPNYSQFPNSMMVHGSNFKLGSFNVTLTNGQVPGKTIVTAVTSC